MSAALVLAVVLAPTAEAAFPGPNGRIAFARTLSGNSEIYSVNTFGSGGTQLTNHGADDRSPTWSASGTQLAFASNRDGDFEIYRMPAAGSPTPTPLTSNSIADGSPAWAPSSTQLVIVREATGGDTDLVILAADGSGTTTPLTAAAAVSGEVEPTWSPDGTRIGFAAFPPGGTQRDIFSINPDGTGLLNLTSSPDRDDREPNWSPGNARITYSSLHDANYEIHVMNADGTGDVNITNYPSADDRNPAWSPDATRIVHTSQRVDGERIINRASTGVYPLTIAYGTEPDWGRDSAPGPQCNDGIDNDGDGQIDFPNDPGCNSASDNDEFNPPPPACSDGVDNDGDGQIDFPNDPGCTSSSDNDEFNPAPTACSDGVDNDGDGQTDFPDDIGCTSADDNDETNPQCSDGIDNDGDTLTDYPDDPGCVFATDNDEIDAPVGLVRPKSAGTFKVPLVPAFHPCNPPGNRTHGPPLVAPSCNPPVPQSTAVTVGEPTVNGAPANSEAMLKLTVQAGAAGPPDDSNVLVTSSVSDVRCSVGTTTCGNANTFDGADYTGALQAVVSIRISDRWNAVPAGGGSDAATVVDLPFPMSFACANTASASVGGLCTNNTSFNAIVAGAIKDRKRMIIELGQVDLNDGGSDGNISTTPNTTFMKQGVFVP